MRFNAFILVISLAAAVEAQELISRPNRPITDAQLEIHRFEELWSSFLPDVDMRGAYLIDDAIYIYTHKNQLISLAATDGIVRWIVDLPYSPDFPPTVYKYPSNKSGLDAVFYDEVYVVGHDRLIVIDKEIGTVKFAVDLKFSASSSAWGSSSHIFVGSWDDRVYAIQKRKERTDWFFRTDGDVTIPGTLTDAATLVPSQDGKVYFFDPATGKRLATTETLGSITCTPLYYRERTFIGSEDHNLYCFSGQGSLLWRYPADDAIRGPITVFPSRVGWYLDPAINKVYVPSKSGTLFAVQTDDATDEKKSFRAGDLAWKYEGVKQVLARGYDNVFVRDKDNRLVAIEDSTGKVQFTDELISSAEYAFTNPVLPDKRARRGVDMGGTIFVGWKNGWFMGFREKPRY